MMPPVNTGPLRWAPCLAWSALAVMGGGASWFGFLLFGLTTSHAGVATWKDWIVNTSIFAGTVVFFAFALWRAVRAWGGR